MGESQFPVSEKQRFRAYGAKGDSGLQTGEVAEDGEAIARVHSLEEIGLRGRRGQLTAEGTVFVKLLRGGGAISCAGNEMVVVKLAERLREWAGPPGDPIQLAKAARRWAAVFACSSAAGSDGHWLAYRSNESGKYEVYVRAFPDKGGKWP